MSHRAQSTQSGGADDMLRALRESQRENEILLDAIPDMMLRVRRDGTYLQYKPPRGFQPWKADAGEVIGKNLRDSVPQDVAAKAFDAIAAAISTKRTQQFQYALPVAGELVFREARVVPAGDDEALIIIRDISERRRVEHERDAYLRLAAAIGRIQTRFITKPAQGEVFDGVLAETLAITESDYGFIAETRWHADGTPFLRNLSITDIAWDEASRATYDAMRAEGMEFHNLRTLFGAVLTENQAVIANQPDSDPRRGGLPQGHPALTAFLGVPLKHEGETIGVIGVANRPHGYSPELVEHLSPFWSSCSTLVAAYLHERQRRDAEQRLAQQQQLLAHASRLNTVGEMAAGLAHEITQPLGAISNFAAAAATTLENAAAVDYDRLLQWNRKIIEQASRAGQIIDRLRRFAQRHDPLREPHLLSDIVAEAMALVQSHARRQRVDVQLAGDAAEQLVVVVDRVQIQQVVVNLLNNAIEAIDASDRSDRAVVVRIDAKPLAAIVSVNDSGPGLQNVKNGDVFEPFFTTKTHGMGLGLTICRTIVQAHGGTIEAANLHPRGASFVFTLPRAT